MRKFMLVSIAGVMGLVATAQSGQPNAGKTTFGLTAGVNWNNINGQSATGADLENKLKTGFNGGINAEIPISSGLYLQPGVEYRRKGSELSNGNDLTLSYIDIPVNLIYKPMLGTGKVLLGFGPYVGFGISGKVKSANGTERDVKFTDTYSVSEAEDVQFKKLDAGANFIAGYEFPCNMSVAFKAQLGLININPDSNLPNDQTRNRNTGFGLSLGYRL